MGFLSAPPLLRTGRIFLLSLAAGLGGCASLEQNVILKEEKQMRWAGFREAPVDTPEKEAELARLAPYKLEGVLKDGVPLYRYADPKRKFILTGGPRELAAYRKIAAAQRARVVSNMTQVTASNRRSVGPMLW